MIFNNKDMNSITMKNFNLILVILIASFATACSEGDATETAGTEQIRKTVNVETKTLAPSTFNSKLRVVGNVETKNDIMISAEVSGRVIDHVVPEGSSVKKGQTILKIDDAKLMQEKHRLEAITSQARENYERLKKVFEEDSIGSEIDYLNAKYGYQQSNSALNSIKVDLENTTLKAPFDGTVENYVLEEGEMASPGMPVVRLIGTKTFIVTAGVPARYADVVLAGDRVDVWFDTQNADTLSGKINFVGNSIDPQSRTFKIEVLLPAQEESYKVDMIANLRLNTLTEENVIIVSEEFVYKEKDEFVSYIKAEDENGEPVAERRKVKLGPSYKSNVIIRDGLKAGDELITIGSAFLNEGVRLNIVESRDQNFASNK